MKKFLRSTCIAVGALTICGAIIAGANYAVTVGSGTNFGSVIVSAVHYAQQLICDPTTPSQCAGVSAGGALSVAGPVTNAGTFAVQAAQSGTWNIGSVTTLPALPANQSVNTAQVNGVTTLTGTGATGTGAQRVTVATDQATNAGAALVKGGVGVVNGGSTYQAVAASQTATTLQTSTGAAGDYLSHCVIYPTSTSPGVVTVFDNTNTAATSAILFAGGSSSLSNLSPIPVPVGAVSSAGAWKVTTGASVSVVCYGKFS